MAELDVIDRYGIFVRQHGSTFDFIRFYEDGEVYFAVVSSSASRKVVVSSVRAWFDRDVKPKGRQTERRKYTYKNDDGFITLNRHLNEDIRGEFDGYGRFVCVIRQQYPGTEWLPGFSTERLQEYDPVGLSDALPVFINVASASALAALPGISKKVGANIVEARKEQEFTKMEDLLRVPGFGKKALAACSERCDASQARRSLLVAESPPRPSVSVTSELLEHELCSLLPARVNDQPTNRTLGEFDVAYFECLGGLRVVAWGRGDAGFEVRGYDCDDDVIEAMFAAVKGFAPELLKDLGVVRTLPIDSPTGRFDHVAIVPGIEKRVHGPLLHNVVHRLYPIKSWELPDGLSFLYFRALKSNNVGVKLVYWNRPQRPFLMMTTPTLPAGLPYRKTKKRVLVKADSFLLHMAKKVRDGEVHIWDAQERHLEVFGQSDALRVRFEDAEYSVPHAEAYEVFEHFLKGGAFDG